MASITVKNLVNYNLSTEIDPTSFIHDLSEEQISLYGGMCVAGSQGCSDVIIDFPQKFDLVKIIPKRK